MTKVGTAASCKLSELSGDKRLRGLRGTMLCPVSPIELSQGTRLEPNSGQVIPERRWKVGRLEPLGWGGVLGEGVCIWSLPVAYTRHGRLR